MGLDQFSNAKALTYDENPPVLFQFKQVQVNVVHTAKNQALI